MKKNKKIFWFVSAFGLATIFISIVIPVAKNRNFQKKQDGLANLLGVNIEDYERSGFPDAYFYTKLEIGMTPDEVHRIIQGYEIVYRCKGIMVMKITRNELYYYFSANL